MNLRSSRTSKTAKLLMPVAVGLLLLCTAPALAQRSKQLFNEGSTQYQLGRFNRALKLFEEAFQLDKRTSIIFNIAQCHRQLRQRRKALFFYKLYLTEWSRIHTDKPSPYEKEIAGWIKQLTAEIERSVKPKPRIEPKPRVATKPRVAKPRRVVAVPTDSTPKAQTTPFYKKWWFWTIVGVAVIGATTATIIAVQPDEIQPPEGTLGHMDF